MADKPRTITRLVRNRRPRYGLKPRLVVLHSTEGHNYAGVKDLEAVYSLFNGYRRVSSHWCVDKDGNAWRMVPDREVAYHAGIVNGWSIGIEQVGFAAQTKRQWVTQHSKGLYRVAGLLATAHEVHGIPLKHSRWRGVCQHVDVSGFGGHWDCGKGYPEEYVLLWANLIHERRKPAKARSERKVRRLTHRVAEVQRAYNMRVNTQPW